MDKLLLYKALKTNPEAEISASGNPVTLSGTLADNPLKECKIYGWSKQESTTGKNLFDFSRLVSDGVNVMDYEKQTITVPAKTNNTGYNQTLRDLCPGITPGTYVFSMKRSNPKSGGGSYFLEVMKDFPVDTPIELTNELLDSHISWYNNPDSEVENTISEIQIEIGTEATDYEPYTGGQPSPSPEYPQEIESTGPGSTNLFDKDSISVNYVIEVDGKLVLSAGYDSSDFIPVSSGTYTITATGSVRCKTYDKDKKPFTINTYTDININNGGTFEIAKNVKYIRFSMYHPNVDTIMLNRGSTALPYEAYKSGMIDVTVHGKNLFDLEYATDINNWKPGGYCYIPYYVGKGNKVSVSYSEKLPIGRGFYAVIGQIKGNVQQVYSWLYHPRSDIGKTQFTFTAEEDYIYLNMAGNNIVQSIKELKKLQIEVSSAPTTYEPYHEPQSLSIQTPTGLPAIPVTSDGNYTDASGQQWIADYIDLKRGKYVQNVTTLELMGDENFKYGTDSNTQNILGGLYTVTFALGNIINKMVISNAFVQAINTWTPKIEYVKEKKVSVFTLTNAQAVVFVLDATVFPTKEDFALFLKTKKDAGNPVVLYYNLSEPIERNLTQSEVQAYQELTTYAGTTIVENDAECYMEVSAGGGDALRAKKLALLLGD